MEATIKEAVVKAVRERCGCDFPATDIMDGVFSCSNATIEVTYKATIRGRDETTTAGILRSQIQQWALTSPVIKFEKLLLLVDSTCPVVIQSLDDPECPDIAPSVCRHSD